MAEQGLISGEPRHCEVGRDTVRRCVLPREALLHWYLELPEDIIKPNCEGDPEAGLGAKGDRFTGSTDDSGPKKPGNRVEDKTLKIRRS